MNPAIAPGTTGPIQPALVGLDLPEMRQPDARPRAIERNAAAGDARRPRHRYWSVRDLSRRVWRGRGYELLRELIRGGMLPATRSARTWWIDDDDVSGLVDAFEDRAGKVRAFHGLDGWLRERSFVVDLTPEVDAALRASRSGFAWRGRAYLPLAAWTPETAPDGEAHYRHRAGLAVTAGGDAALAA